MANPFPRLDVGEIIARRRFGRLQFEVVALCALAMFVVGYDTQVIGYAAPAIARILIIPVSALQPVFTWGGIGSLLGIVLIAPLADRSGRRRVIGAALVLIGLTTVLTGLAASVAQFKLLRLLTGLGLGAVLPVAMALVVEYMPRRHRIVWATVVWIGYSLGAGFAGPIATSIGSRYDWTAIFLFGGLLALLAAPFVWSRLPESPVVLLRRGHTAEIRAALIRISRRYDSLRATEYSTSEPVEPGLAVVRLFTGRRRRFFTGLLWGAFFANLMAVALVNAALSPLLTAAGLDENGAFAVGLLAQLGGIAGGLTTAALADRYDRFAVLGAAFLLGALSVAAVAVTGSAPLLAVTVAMVAVFFTVGGQNAALGVTAASYPAAIGATAVALALGVGRIGQIAAPYLAAVSPAGHARFLVYAVPGLAAAAAALLVAYTRANSRADAAAQQEVKAAGRAGPSFPGAGDPRRHARGLEHLASLGLDLDGRRVLEVGAGAGDHTGFFLDRDCTVVSTESRPEQCRLFAEMLSSHRSTGYAKGANCTLVTADVEGIDRAITDLFEVVFCYGLLDRLADPEAALAMLSRRCDGLFLLETCVAFGDHEAINPVEEGSRPTRPWIFARLKSLFPYVYVPRTQPAHEEFPLDWTAPPPDSGLARAVFVASRHPLANPVLLDHLPPRQDRA